MTKTKLNILHMVAHAVKGKDRAQGINGPELRTLNAIPKFNYERLNVTVTYSSLGRLMGEFKKTGVPVIDFYVEGKFNWRAVKKIRKIIESIDVNIIHTQGPGSLDLYATLASRKTNARVVITRPIMIGDLKVNSFKRWIFNLVDRYTLSHADRIVTVSKAGYNHLIFKRSAPVDRTILVYNGVDLNRFQKGKTRNRNHYGFPPNSPVVGACAQLTKNKGWWDFLEGFVMLREKVPEVRALIIGDGPLRSKLESAVKQRGLDSSVIFTGHLQKPEQALQALDLLFFLSHREGLSVAIIEAIACSLPCVVYDVGGVKEQVENGRNGYVVPRGAVHLAAERAVDILTNSQLRANMSLESRRICEERFSDLNMIKAYENIYYELANPVV